MDFRSVHGKDDFDDLIGFCVGNGIPMPLSQSLRSNLTTWRLRRNLLLGL